MPDDASTTCSDDDFNALSCTEFDLPDWDVDDGCDTSELYEPALAVTEVREEDELRPQCPLPESWNESVGQALSTWQRVDRRLHRYVDSQPNGPPWSMVIRILTEIPSENIVLQDIDVCKSNRANTSFW